MINPGLIMRERRICAMKISQSRANIMLVIVAILWGSSYVFAKQVVDAGMQSGLINGCRGTFCIAAGYLLFHTKINKMSRRDLKIGLTAGVINFSGYYLQTAALRYTTPAKNAFLTTMYVVLAPFILWLFWHQAPRRKDYFAIALAVIGMALLSGISPSSFTLQLGDLLTLVSAIFWALQLIYFAKFASTVSSPWIVIFLIGLVQGSLGWLCALLFERPSFAHVHWVQALIPLAILAIVVTFLAQGMQITAQHFTTPTAAGIILMLESLFASLMSVALGFDRVTPQLIIGGIILILANLIMQIDLAKIPLARRQTPNRLN